MWILKRIISTNTDFILINQLCKKTDEKDVSKDYILGGRGWGEREWKYFFSKTKENIYLSEFLTIVSCDNVRNTICYIIPWTEILYAIIIPWTVHTLSWFIKV